MITNNQAIWTENVLLCLPCCLYRFMLEERLSVRVLASAVDDWLLCRVGEFAR